MNLTDDQKKEFDQLSKKMMDFLKEIRHPHCSIHIDSNHAELSEGVAVTLRQLREERGE